MSDGVVRAVGDVVVVVLVGPAVGVPVGSVGAEDAVVCGLSSCTPFARVLIRGYWAPPEQNDPPKSSRSIDQTIQPLKPDAFIHST